MYDIWKGFNSFIYFLPNIIVESTDFGASMSGYETLLYHFWAYAMKKLHHFSEALLICKREIIKSTSKVAVNLISYMRLRKNGYN